MARKLKYKKPMRETRKKVADLFKAAREALAHGRCLRASALYNEAVGIANRKGVEMKNVSFWRMKRALKKCRREYGFDRA